MYLLCLSSLSQIHSSLVLNRYSINIFIIFMSEKRNSRIYLYIWWDCDTDVIYNVFDIWFSLPLSHCLCLCCSSMMLYLCLLNSYGDAWSKRSARALNIWQTLQKICNNITHTITCEHTTDHDLYPNEAKSIYNIYENDKKKYTQKNPIWLLV